MEFETASNDWAVASDSSDRAFSPESGSDGMETERSFTSGRAAGQRSHSVERMISPGLGDSLLSPVILRVHVLVLAQFLMVPSHHPRCPGAGPDPGPLPRPRLRHPGAGPLPAPARPQPPLLHTIAPQALLLLPAGLQVAEDWQPLVTILGESQAGVICPQSDTRYCTALHCTALHCTALHCIDCIPYRAMSPRSNYSSHQPRCQEGEGEG
jgi:hypothetical protein